MNKKDIEFLGKSKQHFNELVDSNIARILKEMLNRTKDSEIKELVNMIDILRMTRKK